MWSQWKLTTIYFLSQSYVISMEANDLTTSFLLIKQIYLMYMVQRPIIIFNHHMEAHLRVGGWRGVGRVDSPPPRHIPLRVMAKVSDDLFFSLFGYPFNSLTILFYELIKKECLHPMILLFIHILVHILLVHPLTNTVPTLLDHFFTNIFGYDWLDLSYWCSMMLLLHHITSLPSHDIDIYHDDVNKNRR